MTGNMNGTNSSSQALKPSTPTGLALEAWSQGLMVGALLIMAGITVSNMRSGVLLHKFILIEVCLITYSGTLELRC